MILTSGILILVTPFLLMFLFEDRLRGFSWVCAFAAAFHLLVSVTTQYLGLFTYPIVLSIHMTAICGVIIAVFAAKRKYWDIRLDPLAALAFCIVFFQLWSVHYDYTGTVNTQNGLAQVEHIRYPYPLYSDEWTAAGLVKYSIQEHSLPLVNPLERNRPFPNLLMVFHSVLAGFFLITGIDPVSQFAVVAVLAGMAVCLSAFTLLKSLGVGSRTSALAILLLPFIAQAGYLPGLWSILPYIPGLIFLLLGMSGLARDDMVLSWGSAILSFALYPPMAAFLGPAYLAYFRKSLPGLVTIACALLIPALLSDTVYSKILRPNADGGTMSYPLWHIMPIIALPFVIIGLHRLARTARYFLLAPVVAGALLCSLYAWYPNVVVIEYGRVVIVTCVLLVVTAGVGLDRFRKQLTGVPVMGAVLSACALLSVSYTQTDAWKQIAFTTFDARVTGPIQSPPFVQTYLTADDIRLFEGITGKRFIAPAWKGLVLGVATDNDPLESKPSTITTKILPYTKFMKAHCRSKSAYIRKYDVSFVYSAQFDCPGFTQIGKSPEGLRLYRAEKNY